jgi:hypothetical protein
VCCLWNSSAFYIHGWFMASLAEILLLGSTSII